MCTLAHVFEGLGFATVALASVREQAERIPAPRRLYCDFPLGRPLGHPNDAAFQERVLMAAFALLDRPSGPLMETFDLAVADDGDADQVSCAPPPRSDPGELAAVDEAMAIRAAYRRTVERNGGRTNFGRALDVESVIVALRALDAIASGTLWKEAGLPADPSQVGIDLRTYYCEAALSLPDSTTGATTSAARGASAWALERWFLERTEAGALLLRARQSMRDAGASFATWFYMVPLDR